ncbi:polymeric immunoglobulin receptor-like protein [Labeo rohita]|nr:polymeric immunoglobulin receptor-like protein [Labeo rohita]
MKQRQCETRPAPVMHMHSAVDMIYPLILLLHITVQWENLQTSDSGRYWCAVEIVGKIDDGYHLYLTVRSGDLQVPVQLTVTKPKRALTVIQSATPSDSKTDMHTNRNPTSMNKISNAITTESKPETDMRDVILVMFLPAMLVLLLLVILIAIVRLRKKPERGQTGEEEHLNSTRNAMPCENQMTSNSPADATSSASVDEGSVIYSAVIAFHKAPSTSVNSEGDVIYSAVNKTPTRRVTSAPSE